MIPLLTLVNVKLLSMEILKESLMEDAERFEDLRTYLAYIVSIGLEVPVAAHATTVLYYAYYHESSLWNCTLKYPSLRSDLEIKLAKSYFKERHSWSEAWTGKKDLRLVGPPLNINIHNYCWILANLIGTQEVDRLLQREDSYNFCTFKANEDLCLTRRYLLDNFRSKLSKLDAVALYHLCHYLRLEPQSQELILYSLLRAECCLPSRFDWTLMKRLESRAFTWNEDIAKAAAFVVKPKYCPIFVNYREDVVTFPSYVLTTGDFHLPFQYKDSKLLADIYLLSLEKNFNYTVLTDIFKQIYKEHPLLKDYLFSSLTDLLYSGLIATFDSKQVALKLPLPLAGPWQTVTELSPLIALALRNDVRFAIGSYKEFLRRRSSVGTTSGGCSST